MAKKVLLYQLKQPENDELLVREQKSGFPPEVFYRVTEKGRALGPTFEVLATWAKEYAPGKVEIFDKAARNKSGRLSAR